jgi:hypothetical protein
MTEFETNLLKMIAAEMHFLVTMTAAREMYGKSYFALGVAEKGSLEQMAILTVGAMFQGITPEFLKGQTTQPVAGFQVPKT